MPRQLRLQYSGAIYHVMSRGNRRGDIFVDDTDRQRFLSTLAEACEKTAWQVHAYCLMRNHFHLVIETPEANLVAGMKWLLGVYTKRFHIRHKLCGHLFAGRYKALIVDGSGNGYLRTVCGYVHLKTHDGADRQETEEAKAQRWVREELGRLGWDQQGLQRRPKGAREKVRLAGRLRRETTMTLKWIAGRLHRGTWTYVSNLLAAQRKEMCQ